MKLKNGLIVSENEGQFIAVAADEAGKAFNGMLKMNATAAYITEKLQNEVSVEELTGALCEKYGIDEKTALESVKSTVEALRSARLIEE